MSLQHTSVAIDAFEAARGANAAGFQRNLELGVLYLADRKLDDAQRWIAFRHPIAATRWRSSSERSQACSSTSSTRPHGSRRLDATDATTRELISRKQLFG